MELDSHSTLFSPSRLYDVDIVFCFFWNTKRFLLEIMIFFVITIRWLTPTIHTSTLCNHIWRKRIEKVKYISGKKHTKRNCFFSNENLNFFVLFGVFSLMKWNGLKNLKYKKKVFLFLCCMLPRFSNSCRKYNCLRTIPFSADKI